MYLFGPQGLGAEPPRLLPFRLGIKLPLVGGVWRFGIPKSLVPLPTSVPLGSCSRALLVTSVIEIPVNWFWLASPLLNPSMRAVARNNLCPFTLVKAG